MRRLLKASLIGPALICPITVFGQSEMLTPGSRGTPVNKSVSYLPTGRTIVSGSVDNASPSDYKNAIYWKSGTALAKTENIPNCTTSVNGQWTVVVDEENNASTLPITVKPLSSGTVAGLSAGFIINANLGGARFNCDGSNANWVLESQIDLGTNVRYVQTTADTILSTDGGGLVRYNATTNAVAVTLPAVGSTGFTGNSFLVMVQNDGTGVLTITANSSQTIGGNTSLVLGQSQGAILVADGTNTNWDALYTGQIIISANTVPKGNAAGNGLQNSSLTDTGALVSTGEPLSVAGVTSSQPISVTGTVGVSAGQSFNIGGTKLPQEYTFEIGWVAGTSPQNAVVATAPRNLTIASVVGRVETPLGNTGTVSVYSVPSGTSCAAGTVIHSGSFNANGTTATNQTLTVTYTTVTSGASICLQATGNNWNSGTSAAAITVTANPT